jgi:hypothetical protein
MATPDQFREPTDRPHPFRMPESQVDKAVDYLSYNAHERMNNQRVLLEILDSLRRIEDLLRRQSGPPERK